jgi:DNA polymerase/3'-5' exonuclease PolX
VRGIGKSIAGRIREYVETGTIAKLEELRAKHPSGKRDLLKVPGLGPKTVELLASELGVTDLDGLRAALDDGRIAELPGLGEKTADNLRRAVDEVRSPPSRSGSSSTSRSRSPSGSSPRSRGRRRRPGHLRRQRPPLPAGHRRRRRPGRRRGRPRPPR